MSPHPLVNFAYLIDVFPGSLYQTHLTKRKSRLIDSLSGLGLISNFPTPSEISKTKTSKTKTPKNALNGSAVSRRYCFDPTLVEWQTMQQPFRKAGYMSRGRKLLSFVTNFRHVTLVGAKVTNFSSRILHHRILHLTSSSQPPSPTHH